jgi:hypothetical protein
MSVKEKYKKIAILDDEPYWCDAIVGLLGREPSLFVVGHSVNAGLRRRNCRESIVQIYS